MKGCFSTKFTLISEFFSPLSEFCYFLKENLCFFFFMSLKLCIYNNNKKSIKIKVDAYMGHNYKEKLVKIFT